MIGAFVPVSDRRSTTGFIVQENGCWDWVGPTLNGYGIMGSLVPRQNRNIRAHRHYYECEYGPIPKGLQIDHLCRNRKCVRPDHLEAVTSRENTLRGVSLAAVRARKTHCQRGHPFTDENTRCERGHSRRCITCERARDVLRGKRHRKRTHLRSTYEIIGLNDQGLSVVKERFESACCGGPEKKDWPMAEEPDVTCGRCKLMIARFSQEEGETT